MKFDFGMKKWPYFMEHDIELGEEGLHIPISLF